MRWRRKEVELVPLKLFSQRIGEGWAMVAGYPLEPGDFAVTMSPPGWLDTRSGNRHRAAVSCRASRADTDG